MRSRIKLNPGEELRHEKSRSKGSMAQTEIDHYLVVNNENEVVGKVIHEDNTSLKGFQRTQCVTQTDKSGNIIIQESW